MDFNACVTVSNSAPFQARCLAAATSQALALAADPTYHGIAARQVLTRQIAAATLAALVVGDCITDDTVDDGTLTARVLAVWPALERSYGWQ